MTLLAERYAIQSTVWRQKTEQLLHVHNFSMLWVKLIIFISEWSSWLVRSIELHKPSKCAHFCRLSLNIRTMRFGLPKEPSDSQPEHSSLGDLRLRRFSAHFSSKYNKYTAILYEASSCTCRFVVAYIARIVFSPWMRGDHSRCLILKCREHINVENWVMSFKYTLYFILRVHYFKYRVATQKTNLLPGSKVCEIKRESMLRTFLDFAPLWELFAQ